MHDGIAPSAATAATAIVVAGFAVEAAATSSADPDSNAFVRSARALGFTGTDQRLVQIGYMLCEQLSQGVPESQLAAGIANYFGRVPEPTPLVR